MANKCEICGVKTAAYGFCRTHKFAILRAYRRVEAEGLLVDKAGSGWWIWDKKGEVLVIGENSKAEALVALDLGSEVQS